MYGYLSSLKSSKETHMPRTFSEFHRNSSTSEFFLYPLVMDLMDFFSTQS